MADYILEGATMRCLVGTESADIKKTSSHGFSVDGTPIVNANDHFPMVNVPAFGDCAIKTAIALGAKQPCIPITPLAWLNGKSDVIIEGAPALTGESALMCMCGGVIMFT